MSDFCTFELLNYRQSVVNSSARCFWVITCLYKRQDGLACLITARVVIILRIYRVLDLASLVTARLAIILRTFWVRNNCAGGIWQLECLISCLIINIFSFRIRPTESRISKYHISPPRGRMLIIWCQHVNISGFNGVLRKFQGCFREVTLMFLKPKEPKKFQGCFQEISRVFQGIFKDV